MLSCFGIFLHFLAHLPFTGVIIPSKWVGQLWNVWTNASILRIKNCNQSSYRFSSCFLPPANEFCEGYVFTPVCQSFCLQGEYLGRYTPQGRYTPWAGNPNGQIHPPGRYTPWAGTPPGRYTSQGRYNPLGAVHAGRYGQQAGGTHPTGMHSCLFVCLFFFSKIMYILFSKIKIRRDIWTFPNKQLLLPKSVATISYIVYYIIFLDDYIILEYTTKLCLSSVTIIVITTMWHRQSLQHQDLQECDLHFCMFQPAQCWDRAGQLSPHPVANRLEYAAALSSDLVPPSDPHCLKKPYFLAPSLCSLTYELSHYWPPIVLKKGLN